MPVSAQTPIITYTASGSATAFSYPFRILEEADLFVYLNDIETTTGFTVTGVGVETGGTVTFATAPIAGTSVKLQRSVARTRTTDYVEAGPLRANTLDNDFDRLWMALQDVEAGAPVVVNDYSSEILYSTYTATQDQTVFALSDSYILGSDTLLVYVNGALQRVGVDYNETSSSSITFLTGLNGGDVVDTRIVRVYPGTSTTASVVSWSQTGAGSANRTVDSKLKDFVSVKDFGAVGDGIANDAPAIQSALNTGKSVFLPNGVYKLDSPVTLSTVGQRLFGDSSHNTYLTGGATHDQVRVAASHCEVDHLHFRPGGYSDTSPPSFASLRVYAALAHVHDNRFLAAGSNHGTAILLDDINPVDSSTVSGAYLHTISNNRIGASTYEFKYAIYSYCNVNGQQGTKIQNNQIISDAAIFVLKGGGNLYIGNVLQSSTGGYGIGTRVGNGIDLQADVVGETVTGNYIERYVYGVITRRVTQDYILANVIGNHWDNNDNNIYAVSSPLLAYFDETSWYDFRNTWQWRYNSQDNLKLLNREGTEVVNINRAANSVEPRTLAHNFHQTLSFTSNGSTVTPVATWCDITGAGSARTGCYLGNGTRDGQHLYIRAMTWSVQILNNPGGTANIYFAGNAASATFGQTGNVGTMHLVWDSTYAGGTWFEISRTTA